MEYPVVTIDDVRICNCASCGEDLLGRASGRTRTAIARLRDQGAALPAKQVAGRLDGRPYCGICINSYSRVGFGSGRLVNDKPADE